MPTNIPNLLTIPSSIGENPDVGGQQSAASGAGDVGDSQLFLSPEFNRAIEGLQTNGNFGSVLQKIQEVRQSEASDLPDVVLTTDAQSELTQQQANPANSLTSDPILTANFERAVSGNRSDGVTPVAPTIDAPSSESDAHWRTLSTAPSIENKSGKPTEGSHPNQLEQVSPGQSLNSRRNDSTGLQDELFSVDSAALKSREAVHKNAGAVSGQVPGSRQAATPEAIAASLNPSSLPPQADTKRTVGSFDSPSVSLNAAQYRKVNIAPVGQKSQTQSLISARQLLVANQPSTIIPTGSPLNDESLALGEAATNDNRTNNRTNTLSFPQPLSAAMGTPQLQPQVPQRIAESTATGLPPVPGAQEALLATASANTVASPTDHESLDGKRVGVADHANAGRRPTIATPGSSPADEAVESPSQIKPDVPGSVAAHPNAYRKIYTLPVEEIQQRLRGERPSQVSASETPALNTLDSLEDRSTSDGLWGNDLRPLPARGLQSPSLELVSSAASIDPVSGFTTPLPETGVANVQAIDINAAHTAEALNISPDGGIAMNASAKPAVPLSPTAIRTDLPSVTIPQLPDVIAAEIREATDVHMRTLTLQLHPADLGQITLQVGWEDELLTAQIITADATASEILNRDRQVLLDSLQAAGIDLASFEVSHRRPDSGLTQDQPDSEGGSNDQPRNRERQLADEAEPPPRPKLFRQGSTIDIVA